jgi:flagellar protein FlbD
MMGGSENCHPFHTKGRGKEMIEVTRLNDTKLILNADMIEKVEEAPDTVITLTSGNKIIVKESRQEVRNLVILYKKEVFGRDL